MKKSIRKLFNKPFKINPWKVSLLAIGIGGAAYLFGNTNLIGTVSRTNILGRDPGGGSIKSASSSDLSSLSLLVPNGGRVDWSPQNLIAFDRAVGFGYFEVWRMNADASNQICLTCNQPVLPNKHIGQPAWHPSGNYIVFQAQESDSTIGFYGNPGIGTDNNLWLMNAAATQFWKLTNIPIGVNGGGVLHAHFSRDGTKLAWAEMISRQPSPTGQWVMRIADFSIVNSAPVLSNIMTYTPNNMRFYETHGFYPNDNTKLIFSATPNGEYKNLDIYVYDLVAGSLLTLTDPNLNQWDEHAHMTQNGQIIWMSSMEISQNITNSKVKTDYWLMNPDGSNKRRVTFFNKNGHPHFISGGVTAADGSWNPSGNEFIGLVVTNTGSKIYKLIFNW